MLPRDFKYFIKYLFKDMEFFFAKLEVDVIQRVSFFGLDFSFSNLTLYLVLSIIVILSFCKRITKIFRCISTIDQAVKKAKVFSTVIILLIFFFNISNSSCDLLMYSFITSKNYLFYSKANTEEVIKLAGSFFKRSYSNQAAIDYVIKSGNGLRLNFYSTESCRARLIDPVTKVDVPPHQLDLFIQKSVKTQGLQYIDLKKNFGIVDFLLNYPKLSLKYRLMCYSKQMMLQRTNTIAEISVADAVRKNLHFIKKIEMTAFSKQPINQMQAKLTGNKNPDYVCTLVLKNGVAYKFHADLKTTNIASFEKKLLNLHPGSVLYSNIYWIRNIDGNYAFSGISKLRLEDAYHNVINFYAKMDPLLASQMATYSASLFQQFKNTGKASDYNNIPINTPKFVFTDWVEYFFT